MKASRRKFKLLHLPIIVIQEVLSNMECHELFDFSLCSKRCKRLVGITRNSFIGISLQISKWDQQVSVERRGRVECFGWSIGGKKWTTNYKYMKINGKRFKMNILSSRMHRVMNTKTPELDLRILVDYLKEIFRIPILHVDLSADRIVNFMKYVPLFSQCHSMNMTAKTVSEEALEAFKAQVTVANRFFINYIDVNPRKASTWWFRSSPTRFFANENERFQRVPQDEPNLRFMPPF
uniref:F-box domain-containing protein n=1 Tax=Caenorhabditis tropicalis TaxID=1561998 RepID=A0A1I7TBG9_9PELO